MGMGAGAGMGGKGAGALVGGKLAGAGTADQHYHQVFLRCPIQKNRSPCSATKPCWMYSGQDHQRHHADRGQAAHLDLALVVEGLQSA